MQISLVVLLIASAAILALVGVRIARSRAGTGETAGAARPRAASGFMMSPVWNVVGVLAGLVGAVTSILGLLKG
jgi:hypothetical protein